MDETKEQIKTAVEWGIQSQYIKPKEVDKVIGNLHHKMLPFMGLNRKIKCEICCMPSMIQRLWIIDHNIDRLQAKVSLFDDTWTFWR